MTKKDYELIAGGIAETHRNRIASYRLAQADGATKQMWQHYAAVKAIEQVAADISARLRSQDPKYDAHKFMSIAIHNNY